MRSILNHPKVWNYAEVNRFLFCDVDKQELVYPTIVPNWDHSPRSGVDGFIIQGECPSLFKEQIFKAIRLNSEKRNTPNIIFLKSWNEWGEGNYMEPDLKFGHGFLNALKDSLM